MPAEVLNPYALGFYINHPPPGECANALLVDFDIPYTFLPTAFSQYLPYMNFWTFTKTKAFKTKAIVS